MMKTQAVVSVVQNGKVIIKVIAGSHGSNILAFAQYLKAALTNGSLTTVKVYDMARKYDLGTEQDLVVLSPDSSFHKCPGKLSQLFRDTFNRPNFNPNWKEGLVDQVIIIDLDR